jgi:sugar-specific transcriptional regulator TrmB
MLSGVLKSEVAIHMSIQIMTTFVSMCRTIQSSILVFSRLDNLEHKQLETDKKFDEVFDALSSKDKIPEHKIFFDGQIFDAHKFVSDLVRSAKKEIILIDNYVDDTVLDIFSKRGRGVCVTIYTHSLNSLDLRKFNQQYEEIVVKEITNTHDRFLIIDNKTTYHFGASIKDLGKKLFAVSKLGNDSIRLLQNLK